MCFDWFKFSIHSFANQRIENALTNIYIMQVYALVFLVNNIVMNWISLSLDILLLHIKIIEII